MIVAEAPDALRVAYTYESCKRITSSVCTHRVGVLKLNTYIMLKHHVIFVIGHPDTTRKH